MINRTNFQAGHWTEDPAQCEKFFTEVKSKIDTESMFSSYRYAVKTYQEDIASEIKVKFLQQMLDKEGPFAELSAEAAAGAFLDKENFWIREQIRLCARKIGRYQQKQSEILADVRQPELPPGIETQLRTVAASIPRVISEMPNFTSRDSEIYGKEVLRQIGLDDLPSPIFDEVAQIAGVSSDEQREYNKYHDEHGRNSASDRKAWSRARAKVAEVLTLAKITSLLGIMLFLSFALLTCFNQELADHQKDFFSQDPSVNLVARLKGHQ